MKCKIWNNPRKPDDVRIYINGLYPYREGIVLPKFWVQKTESGLALLKSSKTFDLDEATQNLREELVKIGKIKQHDAPLEWGVFEALVATHEEDKKNKPNKDRVEGKTKPPIAYSENGNKAFRLDLTAIGLKNRTRVLIDHLENPELANLLEFHPQLDVVIQPVKFGSVIVTNQSGQSLLIKRFDSNKNMVESSVFSGSLSVLSEQMEIEPDTIPVIILEGDLYGSPGEMTIGEIDGIVTGLVAGSRLSVLGSYNMQQTAFMVVNLIKSFTELPENHISRSNVLNTPNRVKAFILEGIPGVGREDSELLLTHFGSIKNIAMASMDSLVKLVGPKKALSIFQNLSE